LKVIPTCTFRPICFYLFQLIDTALRNTQWPREQVMCSTQSLWRRSRDEL